MECNGNTILQITNHIPATIGSGKDSMKYYEGVLKFDDHSLTSVSILILGDCHEAPARCLYEQLNRIKSPYIMDPMAYCETGGGVKHSYVACPLFQKSLSSYVKKNHIAFKMNRFSLEFREVLRNTVKRLVEIHDHNCCCADFKSHHIAVFGDNNTIRAKIWIFSTAGCEENRCSVWVQLADMVEASAQNNDFFTCEVLRHSAMLTVREKFENILAVNLHVLVFFKKALQQIVSHDPLVVQAALELNNFLTDNQSWIKDIPPWIITIHTQRGHNTPSVDTEAGDEVKEETLEEKPEENCDLEYEMRTAWPLLFLKVQNFAVDLGISYC
uniref:Protein kinase domain-containing protein n=1 Tax=Oryza punctata TaxID=4537 RepID=A0A0E0MLD7_ORYPU